MDLRKLAEHFDKAGVLPVHLQAIEDAIRKAGIVKFITFYENPGMPKGVVCGFMEKYNDGQNDVADIYYAGGLDPDTKSLVLTKEMMNIFDNGTESASDEAKVSKLITEMIAPPGVYSIQTQTDRAALVWALIIRFPISARNKLMVPFKEGKITAAEIAALAKLPGGYGAWLMSEQYAEWWTYLMGKPAPAQA